MFLKYSSQPMPILATYNPTGNITIKAAAIGENLGDDFRSHIVEQKDPRFVYAIARAVTADVPNKNHDMFPLDEIKRAYTTFIGRNIFLDHNTKSVRNAVGKIIAAELREDEEGHTYVACLFKVDRELHPDIARKIENGIIDSVSMGANVAEAECSVCSCRASRETDFCDHLKAPYMYPDVYSINHGVEFTELSLVSVPADPTAHMHKVFNMQGGMEKVAIAPSPATDLSPKAGGEEAVEFTDVPLEEAIVDNTKEAEEENNTPIVQPDPTTIEGNSRFYQIDCSSNETADLIYNILAPYLTKGIEELSITGRGIKVTFEDTVKDVESFMKDCISMFGLLLSKGIVNPVTASLCEDALHIEAEYKQRYSDVVGPLKVNIRTDSKKHISGENTYFKVFCVIEPTLDINTDKVKQFVSGLKTKLISELGDSVIDPKLDTSKLKMQFSMLVAGNSATKAADEVKRCLDTVIGNKDRFSKDEDGLEELLKHVSDTKESTDVTNLSDAEKITISVLVHNKLLSQESIETNESDVIQMLRDAGKTVFDDFVKIVQAHPEIQNNYQDYGIPDYLADFLKTHINVEIPKDSSTKEDTTKKDEQTGTKDTKEPDSVKTEDKNKVDDKKQQTQRKPNDTLVTEDQKRIEKELKNGKGNPDIYRSLGDTVPATKDEEKKQEEDTNDMKTNDGDQILSIFDWGDEFANIPEAHTLREISEASKNKETLDKAEKSTEQLLSQIESDVETKQIKKPGKLFTLLTKIKPLVSKMSSKVKEYFKNTVDVINKTLEDAEVAHMKELSEQFRSAIHSYYEPKSIEEFNLASDWLSMLKADLYSKMERVYYPEIQALKQKYGDVPTPSELDIYKRILYLGTETEEGKKFLQMLQDSKAVDESQFNISQSFVEDLNRAIDNFKTNADTKHLIKERLKKGLKGAAESDIKGILAFFTLALRQYSELEFNKEFKEDLEIENAYTQLFLEGINTDLSSYDSSVVDQAKNLFEEELEKLRATDSDSDQIDHVISILRENGFNSLSTHEKDIVNGSVTGETPTLSSVLSNEWTTLSTPVEPSKSGVDQKTTQTESNTPQEATIPAQQPTDKTPKQDAKTPKEPTQQDAVTKAKEEATQAENSLGSVQKAEGRVYNTEVGKIELSNLTMVIKDKPYNIADLRAKVVTAKGRLNRQAVRRDFDLLRKVVLVSDSINSFLDSSQEPNAKLPCSMEFVTEVKKSKKDNLVDGFTARCFISKNAANDYVANVIVESSPYGSADVSQTGKNAGEAWGKALEQASDELVSTEQSMKKNRATDPNNNTNTNKAEPNQSEPTNNPATQPEQTPQSGQPSGSAALKK